MNRKTSVGGCNQSENLQVLVVGVNALGVRRWRVIAAVRLLGCSVTGTFRACRDVRSGMRTKADIDCSPPISLEFWARTLSARVSATDFSLLVEIAASQSTAAMARL